MQLYQESSKEHNFTCNLFLSQVAIELQQDRAYQQK